MGRTSTTKKSSGTTKKNKLFVAIRKLDFEMVGALLEANPDKIGSTDSNGWGPIHHAVECGSTDMVDYLCKLHRPVALMLTEDGSAMSPLHIACRYGVRDVAQVLLNNRADLFLKDGEGKTPLDRVFMSSKIPDTMKPAWEEMFQATMTAREKEAEEMRKNNDVAKWLAELKLGEYVMAFVDNGFETLHEVAALTEDHLLELGIGVMGHRLRVLGAAAKLAPAAVAAAPAPAAAAPAIDPAVFAGIEAKLAEQAAQISKLHTAVEAGAAGSADAGAATVAALKEALSEQFGKVAVQNDALVAKLAEVQAAAAESSGAAEATEGVRDELIKALAEQFAAQSELISTLQSEVVALRMQLPKESTSTQMELAAEGISDTVVDRIKDELSTHDTKLYKVNDQLKKLQSQFTNMLLQQQTILSQVTQQKNAFDVEKMSKGIMDAASAAVEGTDDEAEYPLPGDEEPRDDVL